MFDIGFSELMLVGVVALIVLGPERLPRAARMAGLWMRKARASWYAMRSEFERELADEDLRRSLKQGGDEARAIKLDIEQSTRAIGEEFASVPRAAEEAARSLGAGLDPAADDHGDAAAIEKDREDVTASGVKS